MELFMKRTQMDVMTFFFVKMINNMLLKTIQVFHLIRILH